MIRYVLWQTANEYSTSDLVQEFVVSRMNS